MGARDSCLETSICPPAFIPDHSYEIKFNKNLFLRHQPNEIQPFLNNRTQWDGTAEETSCSTCISQVRHFGPQRATESVRYERFFRFCRTSVSWSGAAPVPAPIIVQPFQSESPSALLSEIGNPFSWTRFLASLRGVRGEDTLRALSRGWTGTPLGLNALILFHFSGDTVICNIWLKLTRCCSAVLRLHLTLQDVWIGLRGFKDEIYSIQPLI